MSTNVEIKKPLLSLAVLETMAILSTSINDVTEQLVMEVPVVNLGQCRVDPFSNSHD